MSERPSLEALRDAKPTSISDLHPDIVNPTSRVLDGVVTVTWPYSIVKNSIAFVLAERDVLLRRNHGQLRLEFHGPSGKAVAAARLGGGDEVRISLDGAHWVPHEAKAAILGEILEWQLTFTRRLLLNVRRGSSQDEELIDIDAPEDETHDAAFEKNSTKSLSRPPSAPAEPGNRLENTSPIARPADSAVSNKRLASNTFEAGDYPSPAFMKRARLSYGSLFEGESELFGGGIGDQKPKTSRRNSRFSMGRTEWKYSSRSPSPEMQEASEAERHAEEPSKNTLEGRAPDVTEQASQRSTMVDEGCQTQDVHFSPTIVAQASMLTHFSGPMTSPPLPINAEHDPGMCSPSRTLFGHAPMSQHVVDGVASHFETPSLEPASTDQNPHLGTLASQADGLANHFGQNSAATDLVGSVIPTPDRITASEYHDIEATPDVFSEPVVPHVSDFHQFIHDAPDSYHEGHAAAPQGIEPWRSQDAAAYPRPPEQSEQPRAALIIESSPPTEIPEVQWHAQSRFPPETHQVSGESGPLSRNETEQPTYQQGKEQPQSDQERFSSDREDGGEIRGEDYDLRKYARARDDDASDSSSEEDEVDVEDGVSEKQVMDLVEDVVESSDQADPAERGDMDQQSIRSDQANGDEAHDEGETDDGDEGGDEDEDEDEDEEEASYGLNFRRPSAMSQGEFDGSSYKGLGVEEDYERQYDEDNDQDGEEYDEDEGEEYDEDEGEEDEGEEDEGEDDGEEDEEDEDGEQPGRRFVQRQPQEPVFISLLSDSDSDSKSDLGSEEQQAQVQERAEGDEAGDEAEAREESAKEESARKEAARGEAAREAAAKEAAAKEAAAKEEAAKEEAAREQAAEEEEQKRETMKSASQEPHGAVEEVHTETLLSLQHDVDNEGSQTRDASMRADDENSEVRSGADEALNDVSNFSTEIAAACIRLREETMAQDKQDAPDDVESGKESQPGDQMALEAQEVAPEDELQPRDAERGEAGPDHGKADADAEDGERINGMADLEKVRQSTIDQGDVDMTGGVVPTGKGQGEPEAEGNVEQKATTETGQLAGALAEQKQMEASGNNPAQESELAPLSAPSVSDSIAQQDKDSEADAAEDQILRELREDHSPNPGVVADADDDVAMEAQANKEQEREESQQEEDVFITVRSLRSHSHRKTGSWHSSSSRGEDPSLLIASIDPQLHPDQQDELEENHESPFPSILRAKRGSKSGHGDPSVLVARASLESPTKADHDFSSSTRITRSMTEQSEQSQEAKTSSPAATRLGRQTATPEPRTQTQSQKEELESIMESPSVSGSVNGDESSSVFKRQLVRELRGKLPDHLPLKSLRSSVNKTADILAVATVTPPQPHRPKHGPRDYMLELHLTDPSSAPSGVSVAHIYRPHQTSLPVVHAGDVVLLRRVQVVSIKGRGFGFRVTDASAWAVFEKGDEEMLPQIKGPPVEVAAEEVEYAAGLRKWWAGLDSAALAKMEKATLKVAQAVM